MPTVVVRIERLCTQCKERTVVAKATSKQFLCWPCRKPYQQKYAAQEEWRLKKLAYFRKRRREGKTRISDRKSARKNRLTHPVQYQSRLKLSRAIASGFIKKPSKCSVCHKKNKRIHGHHEDYSKPLDVIWMCPWCHSQHHRMQRKGAHHGD